jgi:HlyD family secretion protein
MGQLAKITIDAMPGQTFTGKVTEIGNSPIQTGTGAQASTQATNFKVVVTLDKEIAEVRPGFTCTAVITTAVRDSALAVPIQATTVREVIVDDKGNIIRPPEDEKKPRRPSAVTAQAAELKPGQTRKELEGVFVVQTNKAVFMPVKTGIAGEKYFEVLSGLKEGDAVITGPFASVRTLAEGVAVKTSTTAPKTKP